ncbi:MAG TPA: Ig-like domain-containing protein, partial [Planctomycetota bacterium]|nr:Ig-like domain-containing protein [Planctomycetota bacterium]
RVTVTDEYTFFVDGAPKVAGATAKLIDPLDGTTVAETTSGADGIALLSNVKEGQYILEVRAERHGTYRAGVTIVPGQTTEMEVFIERQVVTYNWTVVPTEIEDHYRITLEAVFETNVPIPVVTVDPAFIVPIVIEGETTQMEFTMTNHGLIAVKGLTFNAPVSDSYNVVPLITEIDELAAKSSITIPVLISLKQPLSDAEKCGTCSGSADSKTTSDYQIGGGCEKAKVDTEYYYECGPDRKWHKKSVDIRPIKAAKSLYDCLKAIFTEDSIKLFKGNAASIPAWAVGVICDCLGADKCACAILKVVTGAIGGAAQGGGWVGALVGGAMELPGLWDCICITIGSGSGSSSSSGGWGWGGGWGGPGGGGGAYSAPVGFTTPSPGCTPGDIMPASTTTSASAQPLRGTSEITTGEEPPEEGVCARVRLRLTQDLVMTRSAFLGTLELDNGDEFIGLEGISVSLAFENATGNAADDLFAVREPKLTRITAVDGTGSLGPNMTGTAEYIIIPTREAAPDAPTKFTVGGTLRYIEQGKEVVLPLFPAVITVYPDPVLVLSYFWEREVFSDDPFTDEIEPAIPFNLGLILTNIGKGIAKNVRIISGQPEIIENEKGLLIDFRIIATQVGNQEVQPSLTAVFGNIDPSKSGVARWLMVSTLQGKFIEYSATFEHLDAIGDKHISLIDTVDIHELIHVVKADRPADDDIHDFLANDIEDENFLADTLWLSDGSSAAVQAVTDAVVTTQPAGGGLVATVTATMPPGFAYLRIPDPGQHIYKITSVVRSDGKVIIPDYNAWLTHRVRRPVGQPVYDQDRLHIFDFDSTGSYTVNYEVDWLAVDHTAPASAVNALPPVTRSDTIQVQWTGQDEDPGSGISFFDVFVSINGGPFNPWLTRTTQTGAIYVGQQRKSYAFYSIAVDKAGNREDAPVTPDAATYIPDMIPPTVTVQLDPASDSGTAGDNCTSDTTPAFKGITETEAQVTVNISGPNGYSVIGNVTANAVGQWAYTVVDAMPDGAYSLVVSAVDTEGNNSLVNATLTIKIDTTPPVSTVTALPAESASNFRVSWSATDGDGCGAKSYDVYVSDNGGPFSLWLSNTTLTSSRRPGALLDHTYALYCIARDHAGNVEQKAPAAEATTLIIRDWPVPFDVNLDCKVDILDLIFTRNRLNQPVSSSNNWQADVNKDNRINLLDLIQVRNRLGDRCN